MVRELAFDVCEMAIVTYLMAKAYGKPLVLLPAVMVGRFQHAYAVYKSERGKLTPSDLAGRRVGIRSFTTTTGAWIRGILANDYGVDLDRIMPVNHLVVVKESLAKARPEVVEEVYRMLSESKKAAKPTTTDYDPLPFGVDAMRGSLELIIEYAAQQKLIPRRFTVEELFDDTTRRMK